MAKVKDIDRGYKAFMRQMNEKGRAVAVGIQESEGSAEAKGSPGVQVIDVAQWNEFGTERIPARSFIRAWFDEYQPQNQAVARRMATSVLKGMRTTKQAMEALGVLFVGQIQQRIAAGIDPANAESTIRRKGSSTPLIDTGQLRSSVTYRVEGL